MTQRFDFLVAEREQLQDTLLEFHEDHIMARFPLWDCESPPCVGSVAEFDHDHEDHPTSWPMKAALASLRVVDHVVQIPTMCMSRRAAP